MTVVATMTDGGTTAGSGLVALVTVTYNSAEVIVPFLECCSRISDINYLLIVVDNKSTDATLGLLSEHAGSLKLEVIRNEENLGVAEGNNIGIRRALELGCEYVVLINNDVEFDPELISGLVSTSREMTCPVVVPRIYHFDNKARVWYGGGRFARWSIKQAIHLTGGDVAREVGYAPTCCMLVHSCVFAVVGEMDACYFVYWDDADFCFRMAQNSIRMLYQPSLTLYHKVSSLTGGAMSPLAIRMYSRNQVYFMRKYYGPLALAYFLVLIQLKCLARLALGMDRLEIFLQRQKAILEGFRMSVCTTV